MSRQSIPFVAILAAASVQAPAGLPGLNLLEAAAGKGRLPRDVVFGEIFEHTAVDIDRPALNVTHRWLRAGDWKLIAYEDGQTAPELYNVARDPFEEQNLARAQPEKVRELRARLDAWWRGRAAE